jgi:hypothetical protein
LGKLREERFTKSRVYTYTRFIFMMRHTGYATCNLAYIT